MRRGFKCKKEVLDELKEAYDDVVNNQFGGDLLETLQNFENVAENDLRRILEKYYSTEKSRNQAWKTCKGALYEYAVFRYIKNIVENDPVLSDRFDVRMGNEVLSEYKDQLVIRNWRDIYPDIDILLVDKRTNRVRAILSCKTSLRERLTETAFWKRELERTRDMGNIRVVFVTTDKDNELKSETNRYILLHVVDYTFITDPQKYDGLMRVYEKKYGRRQDFENLRRKIRFIDEIDNFMRNL